MSPIFATLACLSMLGSYAGLARLTTTPRARYAITLGLIAGCALTLALT